MRHGQLISTRIVSEI